MSRSDPPNTFDLSTAIDRLVGDELGEEERRTLLLQIEATADGWRRCALTFLEDQAWRNALAQPRPAASEHKPFNALTPQHGRRGNRRLSRYGAAASLIVAFAGLCFQAGVASVERPKDLDAASKLPGVGPSLTPPPPPGQPVGWVSLVDPAEGEALPRRIPVLAATESNEQWLREQPATIPDYVRAQWERRGFQVEERRRLVGFDLKDGRRVAIPVNEVALDYIGRQPL